MPEESLPSWVTEEPVYVTLVAHDADAVTTTILVERDMARTPQTRLYKPVAFVITFGEGYISVNGKVFDLGEHAMRLCSIADEAVWAVGTGNYGQGHYSDPDAS